MPYDLKTTPPGIPTQTVRSAARLTGVSEKTIHRRIKDGTLPAYRLGRAIRISDDDLMRLYEPVNMAPTDSQARITKLAEARKAQSSYKALRAVQEAQDAPAGKAKNPGADLVHRDPVGDAAAYNIDRPVVRLG